MRIGAIFWASALAMGCGEGSFAEGGAGAGGMSSSAGTGGSGGSGDATSGDSGAAGDEPQPDCDDGDTRACVGPGACDGGQACSDGTWSRCDCGGGSSGTGGAGGSGGMASSAGGSSGSGGAGNAQGGTGGEIEEPESVCVQATGKLVLATEGSLPIEDGDTFTIGDGVNDPVTFEFDSAQEPGTKANGSKGIDYDGTEGIFDLALLVASAINNQGSTLRVSATLGQASDVATIDLSNELAGALGNVAIIVSEPGEGFRATGMSGGKAIRCQEPASCNSGPECYDGNCGTDKLCTH
jgi:hypothetical protein